MLHNLGRNHLAALDSVENALGARPPRLALSTVEQRVVVDFKAMESYRRPLAGLLVEAEF